MSETSREARALAQMVDEFRATPPPELAWDEIEQKLMLAVDKADRAHAIRGAARPSPLFQAFTFAAAAAVLALGIGTMASGSRAPTPASDPSEAAIEIDGRGMPMLASGDLMIEVLRPGDVIDTAEQEIAFALPGSVRWVLAPQSRVIVRSVAGPSGIGHVVALERGSLHAEVTPRAPSEGLVEAFAVEVEQTRIAVHGTSFRVDRLADGVIVDVEHGAIAVGPVGHVGATTGHLLIGPARAVFSLDGGRTAQFLPALAPATVVAAPRAVVASADLGPSVAPVSVLPSPARAGTLPQQAPASVNAPIADVPPAPPVATVELAPAAPPPAFLTNGSIVAKLADCYEKTHEPSTEGVKVSVTSTLTIPVEADGKVHSLIFKPAIVNPEFQKCALSLYAGHFAEGTKGPVVIQLSF